MYSPQVYLEKCCRNVGIEVTRGKLLFANITFIIDEAQKSYSNSPFWNVIKARLRGGPGPRFCLFCSYGSPRYGYTDVPASSTPPIFNEHHRVCLVPVPGGPDLGLFFTREECRDAILRNPHDVGFSDEAINDIYLATAGHPGMVSLLIEFILSVSLLVMLSMVSTFFADFCTAPSMAVRSQRQSIRLLPRPKRFGRSQTALPVSRFFSLWTGLTESGARCKIVDARSEGSLPSGTLKQTHPIFRFQ